MVKKNKNKTVRIGIDARMYGPIGKGLGRYTQEIVDNIIKIDNNNEYIIFLCKENFDELEVFSDNVKKVLADARWYGLKEQFLLPFLIIKERIDLVHFPHFNVPVFTPKKYVVTIHDLILTKFPTTRATTLGPVFYKIKNLFYKIVIWTAVKRAKRIITVSEFTKRDIVDKFNTKKEKVEVTYEGVANLAKGRDSLFVSKLDDKETLLSYNIGRKFILYVGNAYPHKNLEGLIDAFTDLLKTYADLNLVLVGKEDYFYKRIKNYAREKIKDDGKIVFPGYVPDEKLEVLYEKALAYVFPSFYEGFGLPPLEAMAKKCPVVSSKESSMPEVLGDAAVFFNPYNKSDMAEKIARVISNKSLRENLIKKGERQVRNYSWWECARSTCEIYNKIV